MQSVLGMGHFFMGAFLSCLYYPPSLATGRGRGSQALDSVAQAGLQLSILLAWDLSLSPHCPGSPGPAPSPSARPGH